MNHVAHTAYACLCCCSFVRVRTFSCCCYVSAVRCSCAVSVLRAARRCVVVPEAGARSGAPCASEQHSYGATRMIAATMSRAGAGAVAPQPAPRLVWGWFARARGAASWACSCGASWCSATRLRSRIDPAGMCTAPALAARIEPPLRPARPARSAADCSSGSSASRHRALLTRPPIGSGGERFLRRRSELWWWLRCAAKNDRQQIAARGSRSGGSAETSSVHREGPLTGVSIKSSKAREDESFDWSRARESAKW